MADDVRVELSEYQPGAYAVLRGSVPWGMSKTLMAAQESSVADFADVALTHMVKEWSVKDEAGVPLPLPREAKPEDLLWIDTGIVMAIAGAAGKALKKATAPPNGATASSTS